MRKIKKSIMHNNELCYLACADGMPSCKLYYKSLNNMIHLIETKISCMCHYWRMFPNLCTEDEITFITYYSLFQSHINTLNKGNNAIATNKTFICIYLTNQFKSTVHQYFVWNY